MITSVLPTPTPIRVQVITLDRQQSSEKKPGKPLLPIYWLWLLPLRGFVLGQCFAMWSLVASLVLQRGGCFTFTVLFLSCGCLCSVSLPRGAVAGSVVCDCGSFWSYSLVSHAFASVYCCLVVTCWERADVVALVGDVYCILLLSHMVSWVRCGT